MATIKEMRDNTWNGIIPGDNNGSFESVPYTRNNTGTKPGYPETSKAGIKVSDIDNISPIGRKTFAEKHGLGINDAPDYENANYPKVVAAAPVPPASSSSSSSSSTSTAGDDDTDDE
jgi:hypothetical protein